MTKQSSNDDAITLSDLNFSVNTYVTIFSGMQLLFSSWVSVRDRLILLALDVVRRSKEKHFLLLSDSYSSLIALGGSRVDQDTIYKYLKAYSTLTNSGKTVILCWIPGHV